MLVLGVANPRGEEDTYNGLFLTDAELRRVAPTMRGLPVKCEHAGLAVGSVVSAFVDTDGQLNTVMKINESSMLGRLAGSCVKNGTASELSLGYSVDVRQSGDDSEKVHAHKKEVLEVSLVRKGARNDCFITALEQDGVGLFLRKKTGSAGATEEQPSQQTPAMSRPTDQPEAIQARNHGFEYFT